MNLKSFFVGLSLLLLTACKDEDVISPVIITDTPSIITSSSATLRGAIEVLGNVGIYDYGFAWSKEENPSTQSNAKLLGNEAMLGSFEATIDNLTPSTQYFFRTLVLTSEGVIYGNQQSFFTAATEKINPTIQTNDADDVTLASAVLKGQLIALGTAKINDFGFVWSTSPNVDISTASKTGFGELVNPDEFEYSLTGLNQSTQYYFRVFADTDQGLFYGLEKSFKTLAFPWRRIADFPGTPRVAAVAFAIEGKGYVGLGYGEGGVTFKDFWEYDPDKNEWTRKSDFGGDSRSAAIAFSIGDKAYVGTGFKDTAYDDFWEYSPASDQWIQKASLPVKVYYGVGFSIGDRGYVGTGLRDGTLLKEFWEYNPVANSWTRKADYGGRATDVAAGFAVGGKGYIGTGNLPLGRSQEFWEYNPVSNEWIQKRDMYTDRWLGVGFALENKGYIGLGNGSPNDFWEYDPIANLWNATTPFPGGSREAAIAFVIGGKAYVGLGASGYPFKNDFWEFDPHR